MAEHQKVEKIKAATPQTKSYGQSMQVEQTPLSMTVAHDGPSTPREVIQLQRTIGNTATTRLLEQTGRASVIQREGEGGGNFGFTVSGVTALRQPSSMACWATVATMMASYRDGQPYAVADIPNIVGQAGANYTQIYTANTGLSTANKEAFLLAMGLTAEPPASYIARAVYDMMISYGPLWVTTDGGSLDTVHARVLVGMGGDGTPAGTSMEIIDPADGAFHSETYEVFIRRYTNVALGDLSGNFPFRAQIVHW